MKNTIKSAPLIKKSVPGVLHTRYFVGILYILGGLGGLYASFNLAVDRIIRLVDPSASLSCDLSEEVSCGKVDQSWQASLIHWDGAEVPNALIGLVAYAVLITVGVALASGVQFPKWFSRSALGGQIIMLIFSWWLLSQSFFGWLQRTDGDESLYGALCPWCVCLMFSTTIMTFMLTHFLVLQDAETKGKVLGLPKKLLTKWTNFIANYFQYLTLILLIVILTTALLFKYKATLLGLY